MPLLVNADDFGLCAAVNRAVARAHDAGVLTSASLLANGPAFEEAVAIARARPRLAVGVHLNFLRGRPLSDDVPTLTEDGLFLRDAGRLFRRAVLGRVSRDDLARETLAQVARLRAHGLEPSHLDAEKHAHHWLPGLFAVVLEVARRQKIPRVRVVRERLSLADLVAAPRRALFAALLTAIGRRLAGAARGRGVSVPDRVFGCARTGRFSVHDLAEARRACGEDELLEVFVHPGDPLPGDAPIPEDMGSLGIRGGWRLELEALLAPAGLAFTRSRERRAGGM